jgi:hypothetical protein
MLAYVLSQNYYLGAAFGGIPSSSSAQASASFSNISKKDTGSPLLCGIPSGGFQNLFLSLLNGQNNSNSNPFSMFPPLV